MSSALDQEQRNSAESEGRRPTGGFAAMVPELDVTDLEASLAFWCGCLGFDIAYARREAGFAYLERGPIQVMLCQLNHEWDTGPLERPFGRGINFQMTVDRLEPITGALAEAGWPLFRPVEEKRYRVGEGWSVCREFLVQDPDGYLLRFAAGGGAP
ncbi:bleomycin resistance protein [Pseudomonadota bacterium AL_CKDN230030165-1A_HGKHYDSX7]